jgi:hypothetical protein
VGEREGGGLEGGGGGGGARKRGRKGDDARGIEHRAKERDMGGPKW